MKLRGRESGISTLEVGLLVPVLLLIFSFAVPVISAGYAYMTLSRATAAGIRYATRTDTNARGSSYGLTRRPTSAEVEDFIRQTATPLTLQSVEVDPQPVTALPGETVTVVVRHEITFGPMAALVNSTSRLLSSGRDLLPSATTITVTARGREE